MKKINTLPLKLTFTFLLFIHFLGQAQDFNGVWKAQGFTCNEVPFEECISISHDLESGDVTATKLTSDPCGEVGDIVFFGNYDGFSMGFSIGGSPLYSDIDVGANSLCLTTNFALFSPDHLNAEFQHLFGYCYIKDNLLDSCGDIDCCGDVNTVAYWQCKVREEAGVYDHDASKGLDHNMYNVVNIYNYYAHLYSLNPEKYKWAGLAKLVGNDFYGIMQDLHILRRDIEQFDLSQTQIDDIIYYLLFNDEFSPHLNNVIKQLLYEALIEAFIEASTESILEDLAFMEQTFLSMQRQIFEDLAWQFLAYDTEGKEFIQNLLLNDSAIQVQLTQYERDALVAVWEAVENSQIDLAIEKMSEHEQWNIIQDEYDAIWNSGKLAKTFTTFGSWTSPPLIENSGTFYEVVITDQYESFLPFDVITSFDATANAANAQDRWDYFLDNMLGVFIENFEVDLEGTENMISDPLEVNDNSGSLIGKVKPILAELPGWQILFTNPDFLSFPIDLIDQRNELNCINCLEEIDLDGFEMDGLSIGGTVCSINATPGVWKNVGNECQCITPIPRIRAFEGINNTQDIVFTKSALDDEIVKLTETGLGLPGFDNNDKISSLILTKVPAGRVFKFYDDPNGSRNNSWAEIRTLGYIEQAVINTLEINVTTENYRLIYHPDDDGIFDEGKLNGKVSRYESSSSPSGPMIDLYEGNNLFFSADISDGYEIDFTNPNTGKNDRANRARLYDIPPCTSIYLYNHPSDEDNHLDAYLEIITTENLPFLDLSDLEDVESIPGVEINYYGTDDLNGNVSMIRVGMCDTDCPNTIDDFDYLGEYENHKYFISDESFSWQSANIRAQDEGGYLTAINSENEHDFLRDLIGLEVVFIGISDASEEGVLTWSNGEPVLYAPNDIINSDAFDFGTMVFWDNSWWFDSELVYRKFIIEIPCNDNECTLTGQSCNDNIDCTENDTYDENCNCQGTIVDCDGGNTTIVNCNDNNPNTENDIRIVLTCDGSTCQPCMGDPLLEECPPSIEGFTLIGEYENHKYYLSDENENWESARLSAQSIGGYLAAIDTPEENEYVRSKVGSEIVFIGFNDRVVEGVYNWANNALVTYTNLFDTNDDARDYGTLLFWNGGWGLENIYVEKRYVVELPCEGNSVECLETIQNFYFFGSFGNSNYFLSQDAVMPEEAQLISENYNGHLAVINSLEENEFISGQLGVMAYIGLNDVDEEGEMSWVNNAAVNFINFDTCSICEVNSNSKDFTVMNFWDGTWSYSSLWSERPFIMEIPCANNRSELDARTHRDNQINIKETASTETEIYPNPASQTIFISINNPQVSSTNVKVFNLNGENILSLQVLLNSGDNLIELDVETMGNGLYHVYLEDLPDASLRFVKCD